MNTVASITHDEARLLEWAIAMRNRLRRVGAPGPYHLTVPHRLAYLLDRPWRQRRDATTRQRLLAISDVAGVS
jgi:hypothetical protein